MADQKIKLQVGADTTELMAALDAVVKKTQQVQNQLKALTTSPKAQQPITMGVAEKRYQEVLSDVNKRQASAKADLGAEAIARKNLANLQNEIRTNEQLNRVLKARGEDSRKNQEDLVRLKEKELALQKTINITQGRSEQGAVIPGGTKGGTGGGGTGGMGAGGITSIGGLASALGAPAAFIGAAATTAFALKAGESIRKALFEAQYEARSLQTQAFNTQGQSGQLLESAVKGNGLEDIMFANERTKGQAAGETMVNARHGSYADGGASEKWLRSHFPRYTSAVSEIEHGRPIEALRAAFTHDAYKASIKNETANEAALQTQIEKNAPENKATTTVREKFLQDYQRNLGFQRQTGMSENQFRNFNITNASAGFGEELGMGASSAIMAAGGGTRNARGNARFSLEQGRKYDLTNASQALGALGGQLGSAQMSKDALIAVQSEGTRLGINRSDFREENRRFVEMASAAIGQSSATSKESVGDVLSGFAKFMGGANTTQSLAAGKNAYEAYQALSKSQSGPEAVLRQVGMRNDPVLGKLTQLQRNALSLMSEEDVASSSETIASMEKSAGIKPGGILKSVTQNNKNSAFINPQTRELLEKFKKADMAMQGPLSPKDLEARTAEFKQARGELLTAGRYSGAMQGMSEKEGIQFLEKYRTNGKLGQAEGNALRPGDIENAKQAELSKLANQLFVDLRSQLGLTSTSVGTLASQLAVLRAAINSGDVKKIDAAFKRVGLPAPAQTPTAVHTGGTSE